jgi:hypothetical protein
MTDMGRPTLYSPEMVDTICGYLAEGMSLRTIQDIDGMPDKATILRWLPKYPEFRDQYVRACEARSDAHAEELLEIADDATNDWMASNNPDNPGYRENGEAIRRSQLRIETRKWLMGKHGMKKYGDKQHLEHTTKDGAAMGGTHELGAALAFALRKAAESKPQED